MKSQSEEGFYLEPTTFGGGVRGGRVRVGGPDGAVEGVLNEVDGGSFYAVALRRSRVESMSAPEGWTWADETFAGVHDDATVAARAVHAVYGGECGPHEL
jgi:hypothetical protein